MIASALIAAIGKGRSFRAWSRSFRMARSGPSPIDHRWQAGAIRHQQAGLQISTQVADPRGAGGFATRRRARHGAWPVGQRIARPRASDVAVVALANKPARIAWAVLRRGETFTVKVTSLAAYVLVGRRMKRFGHQWNAARLLMTSGSAAGAAHLLPMIASSSSIVPMCVLTMGLRRAATQPLEDVGLENPRRRAVVPA
jgi:hypothetical protein